MSGPAVPAAGQPGPRSPRPGQPRIGPAQLYALVRDAALAFSQDNAPRLAAALSYYAVSAVAPLLFLVTVVAGYFLGQQSVQDQLIDGLRSSLGVQVASFIRSLLPKNGGGSSLTWASVIGALTVFLTATGLFVQLQGSLNALWGAEPPPPQNLWTLLRTRLIAFALVLVFGGLIIAFLVGNTVLAAVAHRIGDLIGFGAFFVRAGTFLLGCLMFTPVFAFIYKFLPDVKLQWRDVWVGAAITAVLFTLGQALIGLYFGRTAASSVYGAAGALFLMLLWIYYSSMIVFFGAEVTWVYSQQYGTQAGGATNPDKKQAVAEKGVSLQTAPSAKEREAAAQTPDEALTPSQRRSVRQNNRRRDQDRPAEPRGRRDAPAEAEVPGVGMALREAALAVLAVPAVVALQLLRLLGLSRR